MKFLLLFVCFGLAVSTALFGGNSDTENDGYETLCEKHDCVCPKSIPEDAELISDQYFLTVDCSNKDIASIDTSVSFPKNIHCGVFKENKIKKIIDTTFTNGENVMTLDLSQNEIDFLGKNAFKTFKNLHELVLSHNRLWNFPLEVFEGLGNLLKLDLSYNRIQSFDSEIFVSCKKLKEVDLKHNLLSSITANAFEHLPSLEKLVLENAGLKELPEELFQFNHNLKYLYLGGNSFTVVPNEALQKATSLLMIDLSSNHLHVIGFEDFQQLTSLTTIHLERIPTLKSIEENAFQDLGKLRNFYCNYNYKLKSIHPRAFANNITQELPPLSVIELRNNALETLSADLVAWKELRDFDLRHNPWRCDCSLQWLSEVEFNDQNKKGTVCKSPKRLEGKEISDLSLTDLICPVVFDGDVLLVSMLVFMIVSSLVLTGIVFLFIRNGWLHQCTQKLKKSKKYVRVVAQKDKDRVELEWDDSAEP